MRIAGVDVGQGRRGRAPRAGHRAAVITMRIEDEGRPIHEDATVKIRPRMFLEGNWFIDLEPGTPAAAEIDGRRHDPGPADAPPGPARPGAHRAPGGHAQEPPDAASRVLDRARGRGGRRLPALDPATGSRRTATRRSCRTPRSASAQHDLSELHRRRRAGRARARPQPAALKSLITDFNTAAGAFAREAGSLERAIGELPRTLRAARPALAALNEALPVAAPLRRRPASPSIRESGETIDVASRSSARRAGSCPTAELRGLAHDLRPTAPALARLTERRRRSTSRCALASSCENEVLRRVVRGPVSGSELPGHRPGLRGGAQAAARPVGREPQRRRQRAVGARADQRRRPHGLPRQRHLRARPSSRILGTNPPMPDGVPPLRPRRGLRDAGAARPALPRRAGRPGGGARTSGHRRGAHERYAPGEAHRAGLGRGTS